MRYPTIGEVKPVSAYKRHLKTMREELSLPASRSTFSVSIAPSPLTFPSPHDAPIFRHLHLVEHHLSFGTGSAIAIGSVTRQAAKLWESTSTS